MRNLSRARGGLAGMKTLILKSIAFVHFCCHNKASMKKQMRVGVLSDYTLREFDPSHYLTEYAWQMFKPKQAVVEFLQNIHATHHYEVYLNLCDGSGREDDYAGLEVVRALEELNLPFTGADSNFYDPTREEMQFAAEQCQLGFARGGHVTTVPEAEALSASLRYPLMVKHPSSFGSTGMTRKSRIKSKRGLASQVRRICERYGSARVEEFIDGREFTVLVTDNPDDLSRPFVYPPAELIFPEGETFLYAHVKWQKWVYLKPVPDKALAQRLMAMTRQLYLALGGVGYARADIRMRADGELVMIEINPNPGILFKPEHLGPADVAMEYHPEGHSGFFKRIFRSASLRLQERRLGYSFYEVKNEDLRSLR